MKKLLTILLVLLVAGFVFADDAKLILESSISEKTYSGFYEYSEQGGKSDFGGILEIGGDKVENYTYDLDMESNGPVKVAFYTYASNAGKAVTVTLKGGPLKYESGDIKAYVPYSLSFNSVVGTDVNTENVLGFGADVDLLEPSLTSIADFTGQSFLIAKTAKQLATYEVIVEFNGTDNLAFGLPKGNYVATVTAEILAE